MKFSPKLKISVYILTSMQYSLVITSPLPPPPPRFAWNAAATVSPALDLCTRYPLLLGGQKQCTRGSHTWPVLWESNPIPLDHGSNTLLSQSATLRTSSILSSPRSVLVVSLPHSGHGDSLLWGSQENHRLSFGTAQQFHTHLWKTTYHQIIEPW